MTITEKNRTVFCAFFAAVLATLLGGCSLHSPQTEITEAGVRFSLQAPDAQKVAVVGDFNQWDRQAGLLAGPDRAGSWTATLPLAPGRYEYLFLLDDTVWVPDPSALQADDGLGGRNSVLVVHPGDP